jgi:hypothetical protein
VKSSQTLSCIRISICRLQTVVFFLYFFVAEVFIGVWYCCWLASTINQQPPAFDEECGPFWVPLGLAVRLTPDGKVEAADIHDDVRQFFTYYYSKLIIFIKFSWASGLCVSRNSANSTKKCYTWDTVHVLFPSHYNCGKAFDHCFQCNKTGS